MDYIKNYGKYMERRGLSPITIQTRLRQLRLLTREAGLELNREELEEFLDSRQLSTKSRALWISSLRCFYKWAEPRGLEDPTWKMEMPRPRRRMPRPMSEDDLEKALASADPRMRCWLLLAACEGLRCMEMAGLQREDISETTIRVLGKGGRERVLPLHPQVREALEGYGLPESGPLFRNRYLRQIPAVDVSHKIGAHLRSLDIKSSGHTLRHRFATQVYRESLDLRLTQELLGHSSPETTAVYAAPDMEKAQYFVESLGPKKPPAEARGDFRKNFHEALAKRESA